MNIKCPHCGTEYEAEESEIGRVVKCGVCGKEFVVGTSFAKKFGETATVMKNAAKNVANSVYEKARDIDWKAQGDRAKAAAGAACDKGHRLYRFVQKKCNELGSRRVFVIVLILVLFMCVFVCAVSNSGCNVIKDKNPLSIFHFGDKPRNRLVEKDGCRMVQYEIKNFLGIQSMTLGYTRKGSLFSICFDSTNDHYSSAESDIRVSKLMQLCDEWCEGIEWKLGKQEHDGRKFAIGRINSTSSLSTVPGEDGKYKVERKYNYQDMVFSIMPTRGERNVVGLQVKLVDNRRRRLETDYLSLDVRRPLKISDAQYNMAKQYLREQFKSNCFHECQVSRDFDKDGLYSYSYSFERHLEDDHRRASISIESGVLEIGGMPIVEDYAEKLINAKIIVMNKEFEGIDGTIHDYRPLGPGAEINLPCPVCRGRKSEQRPRCECWKRGLDRNTGEISISRSNFKQKFQDYKKYYRNRKAPQGWVSED